MGYTPASYRENTYHQKLGGKQDENNEQIIYWSILEYEQWQLYVAKTEKGLCYVGSPGESYEELQAWIQKKFPLANLVENKEALQLYINELTNTLREHGNHFHCP